MSVMTLRALSALLHYPDDTLIAAIGDIRNALREEAMLSPAQMARIDGLLLQLETGDVMTHQAAYVALFDRSRSHCLHLFEHVHGESRDRGQAMVDLRDRYIAAGLDPASNELPDYLPLFLEYCSTLPRAEALIALAEPGPIIALLADRLEERGTAYAAIFAVLADLAGAERGTVPTDAPLPDIDPDDLDALDKEWEEEQITFGAMAPSAPDAPADCPQVRDMVTRLLTPEPAQRSQ